MCLEAWTKQNLVRNLDLVAASKLSEPEDGEDFIDEEYSIV